MIKQLTILVICSFCFTPLFAQKENEASKKTEIIDQRIELLAETSESENFDLTTVFEDLYFYLDHPINLNNTTVEELHHLHLLTDLQVSNLLIHIEKNGKLMSLYELQALETFDLEIIKAILPFVKINTVLDAPHISIKDMLSNGNHEVFLRYSRVLEEMEGFSDIDDSTLAASPNRRYLGSPDKLYARYRFKFGTNVSWGVTAEKDPGEQFFQGAQNKGFDFYSAHLYVRNINKIKHLIVGDYQLLLGQGLTFWSGQAFNKSADVINIKKNPLTIKPYTSVDENLFLRGAASTVKLGKFELTGYYSRNKRDANLAITDSTTGSTPIITSELNSGIHATPSGIEDKDVLTVSDLGSHVRYKGKQLEVGGTVSGRSFSTEFNNENASPYALFRNPATSEMLNVGLDYNYIYKNFNFFGEGVKSFGGGSALLSGVIASIDPRLSVSALYRYYSRDYLHLMVNPFRESNARNEKGLYIGAEAKLNKAFKLSAYFDRFEFPWLRYNADAPSKGIDYLAQLTYRPSKKLTMYVRVKQERKQQNGKNEVETISPSGFTEVVSEQFSGLKELSSANRINYRYNIRFKVSDAITIGNRFELAHFQLGNNTPSKGFLMYQDVSYKPLSKPYSFNVRYALFDTQGWDSRIYAYENDVLYYFSVPAYYNRGSRFYVNVRYKVLRGIDLWLRFAQTYYANDNEIGSGLNQINGNTKSEFRAQVRIKL